MTDLMSKRRRQVHPLRAIRKVAHSGPATATSKVRGGAIESIRLAHRECPQRSPEADGVIEAFRGQLLADAAQGTAQPPFGRRQS